MADWKEQLSIDLVKTGESNFGKSTPHSMDAIADDIAKAIEASGEGGGGSSGGWQEAVEKETKERKDADASLDKRIKTISESVTDNVNSLARQVNEESSRAKAAEKSNADAISSHTSSTDNPHAVTAEQVGAYTKEQVDGFIRNWSGYVVVPFGQSKPSASEAQLGKIYLVQVSNDPEVKDQYEEWISDGAAWSLIGTMSIDLSPYDKIVDAQAREKAINDALTAHKNDSVAHITAAERTKWNGKQDAIADLDAIRSGAALGATALQSFTESDPTVPSWAKQANKPTYTASEVGALTKTDADGYYQPKGSYATAEQGAKADTAVQPSSLATVATSGSYNDLINKPTIPAAITIDSAMSSTSTNPVQNKVVNSALSYKLDFITDSKKITGTLQSFVSWKIRVSYFSGTNGSFIRLWDVTSFKDGSIVNLNSDQVNFKGFFIAGKNQGFGTPEVVEIACKLAYNSTYHVLRSSSKTCGPCICSREEDGVKKYYLGIYYDSSLYSGQGASLCGFFSSYSSSESFSHKNFYGDYTPWETHPAKEPLWTKEWSWSGISDARSLFTARSLGVNLARTAASTFDGSANQLEIPVKGSLPIANGGTGSSTAEDARNNLSVFSKNEVNEKTYLKSSTDNRNLDTIPNDYDKKFEAKGLKKVAVVGLPSGVSGNYAGLIGIRSWSNDSGGNAHEIATTDDGRLFHRSGSSTEWNYGWDEIVEKRTLGSLATKSSVADADISGTISDTHIASASTWNGYATSKQDALTAGTDLVIDNDVVKVNTNGTATGRYSFAQGALTKAVGDSSHAEGKNSEANGKYSHSEGDTTIANGNYSHAEGTHTEADGYYSHAEGGVTKCIGNGSHAEGVGTLSYGLASHAEGNGTIAYYDYQHAGGKFNSIVDGAEVIGCGSGSEDRLNIRVLDWSGNEIIAGKHYGNGNAVSLEDQIEAKQGTLTFTTSAEITEILGGLE